jgi:hypothetical protein
LEERRPGLCAKGRSSALYVNRDARFELAKGIVSQRQTEMALLRAACLPEQLKESSRSHAAVSYFSESAFSCSIITCDQNVPEAMT